MALKTFKGKNNKVVNDNGSRTNETIVNLFKNNKFKNLTYMPNIGVIEKPIFLTFNAKKTFNHLKKVFIRALIF